jgi:hypothetical protein
VDIIDIRLGNEAHRGQANRSARTCTSGNKNGNYTTTRGAYVIHFGLVIGICRSGENEGPKNILQLILGPLQEEAVRVIW